MTWIRWVIPATTPEVVGDQHHGGTGLVRDPLDQLEDLGLDRHVEGRRRLVGDDQLGVEGQGDRDHHPLAHPATQLVGVAAQALLGIGDADELEQLERPHMGGGLA